MTKVQAVVLCVSLAAPALAEARQTTARPPLGGPTTTPSGSYLNLTPRRLPEPRPLIPAARAPRPSARAAAPPRVVCGMTIVPGDPAVDPGMTARVTPLTAQPAIRAVEPPICGNAAR
jgi:hypothetical protein